MKKLAVTALSLFLVLSPSQAKTSAGEQVQVYRKHSVSKTLTRTRNAVARAVPRAQRRLLVNNDITDGNDRPPGPDELDLHLAYRRPELVNDSATDSELSEYVKTRLLVARVRALQKYQEVWG